MPDFGGKLRQARERRGVSLRDIAAHTKFSIASLEALERNDPSRLPGGIFARAFVRSYAAEVGLDPEATVREFVERFDIEPPLSTARRLRGRTRAHDHAGDARSRVTPTVLKLVVISLDGDGHHLLFRAPQKHRRVVRSDAGGCSTDQPAPRFPCSERPPAAVSSQGAHVCGVHSMDPGYRSPLIDMFRRDGNRETRLLAAQGDLGAGAHDQLALLMMLIDDADPDVAMTALSTRAEAAAGALAGLPRARRRPGRNP